MTKDQYFEMCDLLGNEPIEDEIPLEYNDLYGEVQEGINIYNMLQDNWDTMNGNYMGKNYIGIKDIFDIMDVEDTKTCFYIVSLIDKERTELINAKIAQKRATKPAK